MLSCRTWKSLIQEDFYRHIFVMASKSRNMLPKWRAFLKNNPSRSRIIKSMHISFYGVDLSCSAMFFAQKFPNLETLSITRWSFAREPSRLYGAALTCLSSVKSLDLWGIRDCTVPRLLKLINSFRSLSKLRIIFEAPELDIVKGPLPTPCKQSTFRLTYLEIMLIPGIHALLDWFVRANPFISRLKHLTLMLWNKDQLESACGGMKGLLYHCSNHLEELTLWIQVPGTDEAVNLSECIVISPAVL